MTVVGKLEAVTQQMQEMSIAHRRLRAHNEYMRKQLGDRMKQKQKLYEVGERSGTKYRDEEEASNASSFLMKKYLLRGKEEKHDLLSTQVISKLKFLSLKLS